ncbi:MAG: sulfite exporter TauE/SafE family protein [Pseudomonadota bacterium]
MSLEVLVFLAAGALAGGFINGLAGFGTALFALGWWLQIMPPVEAVAMSVVLSVASGVQGMILVWRTIDWRRLMRFLLPALFGIPIGIELLRDFDPFYLKMLVAGFLLLYGGFFVFRRELPNIQRATPGTDVGVGFASGVLASFAGLSGALPTMWCAMRDWPKAVTRAVLQPFNFFVLTLSALLFAYNGAYDGTVLFNLAVSIPLALVAAKAGIIVFKRLSDATFRRLLIILMFASGVLLIVREALV